MGKRYPHHPAGRAERVLMLRLRQDDMTRIEALQWWLTKNDKLQQPASMHAAIRTALAFTAEQLGIITKGPLEDVK